MSTVDPAVARTERERRLPSNALVIVLLAFLLIGGVALGFGWGGFGAVVGSQDTEPGALTLVSIAVGMVLSIGLSIPWTNVVLKRRDVGLAYGVAASLVGSGAGVLLASVGFGASPVLTAIGTAVIVLGIAALGLGIRAARARQRQAAIDDRIMATGRKTTATVTDKGYVAFTESARILATVTFTFVDLGGVQRWVQRAMIIHAGQPVVEGQETSLWYDPADPSNEKSIVVELARDLRS